MLMTGPRKRGMDPSMVVYAPLEWRVMSACHLKAGMLLIFELDGAVEDA
jgi:hypothetical protein